MAQLSLQIAECFEGILPLDGPNALPLNIKKETTIRPNEEK